MSNNKITFPQFLTISFLSSLSFLLFIKNIPSIYLIICALSALTVNFFVIILYRGQAKAFLLPFCGVYLALYCTVVISKFADYMYRALSYDPMWLIIIIFSVFAFFCTVKGIEAVSRASAIISVFVLAGIIYMLVCGFSKLRLEVTADLPSEVVSSIILLLPSVIYVINYESIISVKKRYYFIASALMLAVYFYFILTAVRVNSSYPIQFIPENSKIGVFKGADCILLAILTISGIYSVAVSATGLFKYFKHRYLTNSLFTAIVAVLSVVAIYTGFSENLISYIFVPFTLVVLLVIIVISAALRGHMYKNS